MHPTPGGSTFARYPALDGLRGLAILGVVVAHAARPEVPGYEVLRYGQLGVDLFFVLSGFLITGILIDSRGQPGYYRSFYLRRALRILPLYYGMVAVLVWIQPELPSELGASDPGGVAEMQAWYWLHATNWWTAFHPWSYLPANTSPVWSLAVEEQFYLLWPLVVAVLPPRRLLHLALGLAALGVFFRWGGATLGLHPRVLRAATPGVFDPLALGAAVAVGMRDPNWRVWLVRWALPLGLTSCSLLVATVVPIDDLRFGPRSPFLLGLAAIIFSALLVRVCSVPPAWLCRGPLPTLGRVSYAVYLFHAFVLSGLLAAGWTDTLPLIAGTVVGSWSIALVSWHTFEKHWLALKRLAPRPALARQDWPYWGLQAAAIDKQPQAGHPRQVGGSAAG